MSTTEHQRKALVVDDSPTSRRLLDRYLSDLGFSVTVAENGLEGLKRLDEFGDVDVALVDWHMPQMNGLEFIGVVRSKGYQSLPMMMVTMECSMEQIEIAVRQGAREFLMKPFDAHMVREKLALLGFRFEE